MQSQSTNAMFAAAKADKVYIKEDDEVVIQLAKDVTRKFVELQNAESKLEQRRQKAGKQKDLSNYGKQKILEIALELGTIVRLPSTKKFSQQFGEYFSLFAFGQRAKDPSKYCLFFQTHHSHPRHQLTELAKLIMQVLIGTIVLPPNQSVSTGDKDIKDSINKITNSDPKRLFMMYYDPTFVSEEVKQQVDDTDVRISLQDQLFKIFQEYFEAVCNFSSNYPNCKLNDVMSMDDFDRQQYLRHNSPMGLFNNVRVVAFDLAVAKLSQDNQDKMDYVHELISSKTRTSLINGATNDKVKEVFMRAVFNCNNALAKGSSIKLVHPHPLSVFAENADRYKDKGVLDLIVYDPEYILAFLAIAKWFTKVILQDEDELSFDNNNCCLLMFGREGTGKTRFAQALSDAFGTYKWHTGEFQSPDIIYGSSIYIEEADFDRLTSPQMKSVLDFTQAVKVNCKQQHPVDATLKTPVFLTSNQYPHDKFNEIKNRSVSKTTEAAGFYRRLFNVIFTQRFDERYNSSKNFPDEVFKNLQRIFLSSTKEQTFNTIYALALMNDDIRKMNAPGTLFSYHNTILEQMIDTRFGNLFYKNRNEILSIVNSYVASLNNYDLGYSKVLDDVNAAKNSIKDIVTGYLMDIILDSENAKQLRQIYQSSEMQHLKIMRIKNSTQPQGLTLQQAQELCGDFYHQWRQLIQQEESDLLYAEEEIERFEFSDREEPLVLDDFDFRQYGHSQEEKITDFEREVMQDSLLAKRLAATDVKVKPSCYKRIKFDQAPSFNFDEKNILDGEPEEGVDIREVTKKWFKKYMEKK